MRTISEIRAAGAAWITESELEWLCGLASSSVSAGAAQVPADTIEKALPLLEAICRDSLEMTLDQVRAVPRDERSRGHVTNLFAQLLDILDAALAAVRTPEEQT